MNKYFRKLSLPLKILLSLMLTALTGYDSKTVDIVSCVEYDETNRTRQIMFARAQLRLEKFSLLRLAKQFGILTLS